MKKKKYSKEFKLDAVSLVLEQNPSRGEAAISPGIDARLISRWVKEHQRDIGGQASRGNGKLTPEQEEIRRSNTQGKRLEMEKERLKKSTVFFAKEMKYSFITQYGKTWPSSVMCTVSGVKRTGYYGFQKRRREKSRAPEHEASLECIR